MSSTLSPFESHRSQVTGDSKVTVASAEPALSQTPSSTTRRITASPSSVPFTCTVTPLTPPTISPGPETRLQVLEPAEEPAESITTVEPKSCGTGRTTMAATPASSSQKTLKVMVAEAGSSQMPSLTASLTVTSPTPFSFNCGPGMFV